MNTMRKYLLFIMLFAATSSFSFADCIGCYAFAKVEIELVTGETMDGYVFKSVYDQEFIVDKSMHEYFNFLQDYINIKKTKINTSKISGVNVDIVYVEDKVKEIKSSRIKQIKEKTRNIYQILAVSESLYEAIREIKPK